MTEIQIKEQIKLISNAGRLFIKHGAGGNFQCHFKLNLIILNSTKMGM